MAGVKSVSAFFCRLEDPSKFIYPTGYTTATGLAKATLSAATQVSAAKGNGAGDYEMKNV